MSGSVGFHLSGLRPMLAGIVMALAACGGPVVQVIPEAPPTSAGKQRAAELISASVEIGPAGVYPPEVLAQLPLRGKAIVVNIPSFELIAFEDQVPVMRSRVIVGKPATPTPVWSTETSVVRFRPTWTPTPSMIRSGRYTPGTRPPGPQNPLGFLAIRLDPGSMIYLHGTNRPELYDREKRALSHGCVRVERWDEVAAWVLGVGVDEVHDHAHGQRTFDMETDGVPVILTYQTEFPDAEGVLRQYRDVYRLETYAAGPASGSTF